MSDSRLKEIENEFKLCQDEITSQFDEGTRKQISDYMAEKISEATTKANAQIRIASENAYKEAIEKFGDPDKQAKIEKVCRFKEWDDEIETIMKKTE
tara:strand:- start:628 stop:918 length:291 start_codon:yes stop_codon:yes gene_type:complete